MCLAELQYMINYLQPFNTIAAKTEGRVCIATLLLFCTQVDGKTARRTDRLIPVYPHKLLFCAGHWLFLAVFVSVMFTKAFFHSVIEKG